MSRIVLSVVVAAAVGVSLTGCSSALSSNSSSEQLQTLKFESDRAAGWSAARNRAPNFNAAPLKLCLCSQDGSSQERELFLFV